jgi:hypothetical protein
VPIHESVILSGAGTSRSEVPAESKDPYTLLSCRNASKMCAFCAALVPSASRPSNHRALLNAHKRSHSNPRLRIDACNEEWLLKNSVFAPNRQNWGDGKCPGALRKSLVGLPNAILFLPILGERVFQHPQDISTTTVYPCGKLGVAARTNEQGCEISLSTRVFGCRLGTADGARDLSDSQVAVRVRANRGRSSSAEPSLCRGHRTAGFG